MQNGFQMNIGSAIKKKSQYSHHQTGTDTAASHSTHEKPTSVGVGTICGGITECR